MDFNSSHEKAPARVFVAASVMVFFLTLSAADSIGFVPNYIDGSTTLTTGGSEAPSSADSVSLSSLPELGETSVSGDANTEGARPADPGVLPERLTIQSIGLDLAIQNPSTRDIRALDALLQKGPARYVDSALLGQKGNVVIFAHSSHLPVVHNQMFKAFNKIPELKNGDSITVSGGGKEYAYRVISVRRADANEDSISLAKGEGTRLTLITCDTLTSISTRWILEAEFVGSY